MIQVPLKRVSWSSDPSCSFLLSDFKCIYIISMMQFLGNLMISMNVTNSYLAFLTIFTASTKLIDKIGLCQASTISAKLY